MAVPVCAGAGGAADAVHVVLGLRGQVVVDDVRDAVDVDAAGDDVGGDEHAVGAVLEAVERVLALRLGAVGVDGRALDAAALQVLADPVGAVLGAGEDEHAVELLLFEQPDQQVDLLRLRPPGRWPG